MCATDLQQMLTYTHMYVVEYVNKRPHNNSNNSHNVRNKSVTLYIFKKNNKPD